MTAKQKANQARFKKVVAEAKKLRKKNPKLTQAQAVKQAWAMTYSKKDVSVGATKKNLITATSPDNKIMQFNTNTIKEAKDFAQVLKNKGFSSIKINGKISKLGAIKRKSAPTKVKAKKGKRTSEMHTDTKSHNVNIRVMSGVKKSNVNIEASKKFPQKFLEQQLAYALSFAKSYQTAFENSKTKREKAFNKKMVKYWQDAIKEYTQYIIKPI
jgi:hypothetical protein